MQAESKGICNINKLGPGSLIPVEILNCDGQSTTQKVIRTETQSIVELGKQLLQSAKNGDTENVRDLMCRGAPFTTDWLGTSALHMAALNNHPETAEVLLRAGISRDARTKVDRTPLHMAAYQGHHNMAQLLLNYGAEVDSRDMLRMTPLHWAVEKKNLEVMQLLLDHGADPNAVSKFNKTPLTIAFEQNREDFIDILQQERQILYNEQNNVSSEELEAATQNLMELEEERLRNENEPMDYEDDPTEKKLSQATVKKKPFAYQEVEVSNSSDENEEEEEEEDDIFQKLNERGFRLINNNGSSISNKLNDQPLKFLQAHGLTMVPVDNDTTIVENAMKSGQTVVLTEAGKLALNLAKSPQKGNIKRVQLTTKKGMARKVYTIRADQIIGQTSHTITARAPNILKKSDLKNGKYILAPVGPANTGNQIHFQSKPFISPVKRGVIPVSKPQTITVKFSNGLTNEDSSKSKQDMDIETLHRKLTEVKREADEFRRQLQKKEEEAEIYKQQLKNLMAQRSVK